MNKFDELNKRIKSLEKRFDEYVDKKWADGVEKFCQQAEEMKYEAGKKILEDLEAGGGVQEPIWDVPEVAPLVLDANGTELQVGDILIGSHIFGTLLNCEHRFQYEVLDIIPPDGIRMKLLKEGEEHIRSSDEFVLYQRES